MNQYLHIWRAFLIKLAASGLVINVSPAVVSGECPFVTVAQEVNGPNSVTAFSGIVREIEPGGQVAEIVTFEVERVWKGDPAKRVSAYQIHTAEAIKFSAGRRYVVVAYRVKGADRTDFGLVRADVTLEIGPCVSLPLEQAEQQTGFRELGPGHAPR